MPNTYNPADPQSLLNFALPLTGKTLGDFLTSEEKLEIIENPNNKGDLGNLIEKYYYHMTPPPAYTALPDFPDAGVELKTTALKAHRKKEFVAKERLKLTSLNYSKVAEETWESNTLMKKCEKMLIIFSLYESNVLAIDRRFITEPILWKFSLKDLRIIKRDWDIIIAKINDGNAHKLSERDTFYLAATTSGSGKMVKQPRSSELAKERSFTLKASYVTNSMLVGKSFKPAKMEPLLDVSDDLDNIENILLARLERFKGMDTGQIKRLIAPDMTDSKHFNARLGYRMLGAKTNHAEEFEKGNIEIKSITLRPNGTPKEDMSFPAFEYMRIVEEEWDQSVFKEKLDKRFLFMIFQYNQVTKKNEFKKGMFWSMSEDDFDKAQEVWAETVKRIKDHDAKNLPKTGFNGVAHVRNHDRKSKDPSYHIPTPQGTNMPKMGFWLNKLYIKDQVK